MRLSEIEKRARSLGVKDTWKFSKKELVKIIQRSEGNSDCFASGRRVCEQLACCWRSDCVK